MNLNEKGRVDFQKEGNWGIFGGSVFVVLRRDKKMLVIVSLMFFEGWGPPSAERVEQVKGDRGKKIVGIFIDKAVNSYLWVVEMGAEDATYSLVDFE